MRRLGAVLMILGAVGVAAGILAHLVPGMQEIGVAIVAGVASPRGALVGGLVLLLAGGLMRRRAPAQPRR